MTDPSKTRRGAKLRLKGGSPPLLPSLAREMPEGAALMDALATEFAPTAAKLETQQAYWLGLNGWTTDRLSGPIMEGKVTAAEVGEQAWAVYATSYWGGMELREHWGMPPVIAKMGFKMAPPFEQVQKGVIDGLATRMAALAGGGDNCLHILPALMREASTAGTVYGIAYNAGVQVVKTEDPPIGQRRPHRAPKPAVVRINARDFMRVDYDLPTPHYLKYWRSAFERAVTANPKAYEKAVAGEAGQTDLREIWAKGVGYGNITWGGDANDKWTNEYFDETIHWSSILTYGMEAVGLAAFVAVINQDPEAAKLAVMGNALYIGATPGWLLGLIDVDAKLPAVTAA
ncbi:MAG: hypothetical protein JWQ29_1516 [Phenylobacterium sp.]|nr:hypothetical protein [Phenylobacterium sp.]